MLDETFYFDGKRAKSKGIELQESIILGAAEPNLKEFTIPGRNGTIYQHDGSYKNRSIIAHCYLLSHLLERDIDQINAWLLSSVGYRRFEDSNDERHFMLARATTGILKSARMGILAPFTLEFDAKPQRFLKSGEKFIDVTTSMIIKNPTSFPALPLIRILGKGNIDLTIAGNVLHLYLGSDWQEISYDAEADTAYLGSENMDSKIGSTDQIALPSGDSQISFTGNLKNIQIMPRWWEL